MAEQYNVDVWPDNAQALHVFVAMSTQWRVGPNGATGLDYSPLQSVMRLMAVPRHDWPEVFDAVRIMEDAALSTIRKSS